jgi:hypothetical protein
MLTTLKDSSYVEMHGLPIRPGPSQWHAECSLSEAFGMGPSTLNINSLARGVSDEL